jgi:outer membrane receptor protein involved in Fe transport
MNGIYLWSDRAQLFARLSYEYYDADKVDTRSNSIGLLAGGAYALSESMSLTALAGVRFTSENTPTPRGASGDQTSTGPLVDLKLEKRFEVGKLLLDVSQALLPSSTGELLNTTAGTVVFEYPVTPRWSFDLNANAYINRYPGGGRNINDRNYFSISPQLTRKLSEWWQLDLAYRFRYQKYQESGNNAVSNAVFLTLRYTWPTEPVSRWSLLH